MDNIEDQENYGSIHRQQGDLISLKNYRETREIDRHRKIYR
jgi:hypothetical protein